MTKDQIEEAKMGLVRAYHVLVLSHSYSRIHLDISMAIDVLDKILAEWEERRAA